mmetsp:Transcript_56479/g.143098  ORF Transcript_56479/g.143098 Transcript_56479/m.143098 type:complete len:207 (-) Transcript_56479:70-690(-)
MSQLLAFIFVRWLITPQWHVTAMVPSGLATSTRLRSSTLCSASGVDVGASASSTQPTSLPRGSFFRNLRSTAGELGWLASSSHHISRAARQSSRGVPSSWKARQAVSTARRRGDTSTTSAPNSPMCSRQALACRRPLRVSCASRISQPVALCSASPWRKRKMRFTSVGSVRPRGDRPSDHANSSCATSCREPADSELVSNSSSVSL